MHDPAKDVEAAAGICRVPAPLSGVGRASWLTVLFSSRAGRQILTAAACGAWMSASSLAILVNRHIMVDLKWPYPISIAWMGLITTTIASYISMQLLVPRARRRPVSVGFYCTHCLPTGFFMALTFFTGNLGYLYLTVAFVQMLKAFCPVATMLLLFMARMEVATRRLVAAVSAIAVGVALASYGELNLSLFGLTAMVVSVVAEAIRLVLTQHLLVGANFHPMEGLFHISSACTLWLALQACMLELPRLLASPAARLAPALHPRQFAAAALSGFAVNLLAILVIKMASSLTLKVLGTVKDACLVTIGVVLLHEQVTRLQLIGYSISIVGFVSYNVIKAAGGAAAASGAGVLRPMHRREA